MWLVTRTAAFTVVTGLMIGGLVVVTTLNWLEANTPAIVNVKPPVGVVSWVFTFGSAVKVPVNGNASASRTTLRLAFSVPASAPWTVTMPPYRTGLGEDRICSDSGILVVLKVWSLPTLEIPVASTPPTGSGTWSPG